ncbi:unnamed protein product [Symbiodinium sp. KB8]|nr:unnamed protein product [Symbiodinium sp. KB8]
MVPKCLGELQAYLDKHPIRFNLVVVILLLPAISAGTLLRAVVSAVVTRQGLVLSATFVAIRIVAEWLGNLYTFFWYVQTSAVSKLEGAGSWSSAGSFLVLGSVASLILGLLTMLVMMALAEPLLQLFSPASVEDTSIMVSIGSAGGSKQGSEDCGIRKQAGVQGAGRAIVAVDPTWSMPSARVLISRPNHRTKPKNPHTHRFPFKSGGSCGGLESVLNSV